MRTQNSRIFGGVLTLIVIVAVAAFVYVWQPEIDPSTPDPERFTQSEISQGEHIADTGMCVVCHTSKNGERNAGGHAMDTPFGTIYSTNITPDTETGIGLWSFEAFERAMRHGVARDGRYLYPAFPYTAFTHIKQSDMEALYAYLMSQPPIQSEPPETDLPFPFNIRPLMAGWNLLFLNKDPIEEIEERSEAWNRGQYLTRALGHCSACHSPRNQFGAEKAGDQYMAGGEAEGWYAPALNGSSSAPIRWTEQALFDYLREGFASTHGAAGGSMAPVVREGTSKIPEADARAMAVYIASLSSTGDPDSKNEKGTQIAAQKSANAKASLTPPLSEGARIFGSACQSCHHDNKGPTLYGVNPPLWLSTSLYMDAPDNTVRVVLNGAQKPAKPESGYMPAFRHSLDDKQISSLIHYMRADLAEQPKWANLEKTISRIRQETD